MCSYMTNIDNTKPIENEMLAEWNIKPKETGRKMYLQFLNFKMFLLDRKFQRANL
jgi:hypothetical protein